MPLLGVKAPPAETVRALELDDEQQPSRRPVAALVPYAKAAAYLR
jgi:hypothetical protein